MTVDEYLEEAPEPQRSTLMSLRQTLRELLPTATEAISYNVPAFKVEGKAVAGYAHFKRHCSYFPHSSSVLVSLVDELDGYQWSKGTLRFPVDEPPPRRLITRLVEARLDELGLGGTQH